MNWELSEAVEFYRRQGAPGDQTALTGLLKEVQREHDGIPAWALVEIREAYGLKESFLLAVIRRIPSLRLRDHHTLELCAGPNCGKCAELVKIGETLKSEKLTVRFVPCMRLCGKGPNIRFDGKLYHRADENLLRELTLNL